MTSIIKVNNIQNSSGTAAMTIDGSGNVTFPQSVTGVISTFTSAETAISASTKTTLAHGLGAVPFQFDLYHLLNNLDDI